MPNNESRSDFWTPDGLWMEESDKSKSLWRDVTTGLLCYLKRNWEGVWCGYVLLERRSPLWSLSSMSESIKNLKAHRGVTYCNYIGVKELSDTLDTIETFEDPESPEEERFWAVGFHCSYEGDMIPHRIFKNKEGSYRDYAYASNEARQLASQVSELLKKVP